MLLKVVKYANSAVSEGKVGELANIKKLFDNMFVILGLKPQVEQASNKQDNSQKLLDLIADIRTKLRAEKQYAMSDYIRDQLANLGIESKDKKV